MRGDHVKNFLKYGRFAFILPYIIIMIWGLVFMKLDLETIMNIAFLMPILIALYDYHIIWLYPICFGISILCVILYKKQIMSEEIDNASLEDKKALGHLIITVIVLLTAVPTGY